ncbi:MAG: KH domain-containing protein [Deltaproteobacteria bacterium]|nr:KH domain-containing protein [Deltaproteobacteria bacterium]
MEPVDNDDPKSVDEKIDSAQVDDDQELVLPRDADKAPFNAADDAPAGQDDRGDVAWNFLTDVLREMQMEVTVHRRKPREDSGPDEIRLEIVGHDAGRVIGKKGQVLAALQYLVSRVVNKPGQPRRHVVLDAEGYRERRDASLATMAKRLGQQAAQEGKIITFEPMNPRDRRVVHLALAQFADVVTRSDGEGEDRRVRIIPVRK